VEPNFHQVAMYCGSLAGMTAAIARLSDMGFTEWSHDVAHLEGTINGNPASSTAYMAFNYEVLPGIEYELLVYDGQTRWDGHLYEAPDIGMPFISHISYHVDDIDAEVAEMTERFGHPIQAFETHDHTNPRIQGKKRFNEVIFGTRELFGHDIKLIQRIPWGDG